MNCCTDIRSKSSAWNSYSSWLIKNKKLIIPTVIKYCKNLCNWCMWKWLATNFQYFSNFWFDVLLVSDVVNNLQYSLFILRFVFCSSISVSVNYWCGNFNLLYVLYSIWYALFVRFWSWDLFFVCPNMRWSQLLLKCRKDRISCNRHQVQLSPLIFWQFSKFKISIVTSLSNLRIWPEFC